MSLKPEMLVDLKTVFLKVIQNLIENQSLCRTKNISALNTFLNSYYT